MATVQLARDANAEHAATAAIVEDVGAATGLAGRMCPMDERRVFIGEEGACRDVMWNAAGSESVGTTRMVKAPRLLNNWR